ncbi:MAG: ComF family protein [Spirochaetales bacterium]|nr:ComF family protein [Spirochaetales bacterium]
MDLLCKCPVCGSPTYKSMVICENCAAQLDSECFDSFMDRCPVCFYPRVAPLYRCERCLGYHGGAYRVFPVARYDGELSYSIIDSLKFHGHKKMASVAALYLKRALAVLDPFSEAILVPVPCSASRLKRYGFDQMTEVCKALKRPYLPLLVNFSGSPAVQQKKLSREERLEHSAGKFILNPSIPDIDSLKPRPIIVVDDIVTTMSTMNAAIRLLYDNGFENVSGASWLAEL